MNTWKGFHFLFHCPYISFLKSIFNALEKRALLLYAELRRAKNYLEKRGIFAKITGSGSAFYTTCSDISFSKVKRSMPKKWAAFEVSTF